MLIAGDGFRVGSLSGGCLEWEIAQHATATLQSGRATLLQYDTRARFGCHGTIDIFVEQVREDFLAELAQCRKQRRRCLAATSFQGPRPGGSRVIADSSEASPDDFQQWLAPPLRLLLIGHGPDTPALESFAKVLGWETEFAESAAEASTPPDEWTAVVVGTHHYGRDFAALRAVLDSPAKYIGLIGSRRRRERLLADLLDVGMESAATLFGPAGLDLGAETPEEIGLSIMAEIQAVFRQGSFLPLHHRCGAIHALREPSAVTASDSNLRLA